MTPEVLIVGAGPTGLVLALWLTAQGVAVRIVDKAAAPGTQSRAMAVQARTLELYRQLGLDRELIAQGHPNPRLNLWVRGRRRARLSLADAGVELTAYPYLLIHPQDLHERILADRLAAMGVTVERETELAGFEQLDDRIRARLRRAGDADGAEETAEAAYLVGCDGARSAVRELLGMGFPGGTYLQTFYVADVDVEGPTANGEAHVSLESSDFAVLLSYGPGKARLIGAVRDGAGGADGRLDFDDVGHAAIEGMGLAVKRVNWFSTYHVHHRVTEHYRRHRAFLAGDAAHVHSPAGGQGMNTGIGDAINLAWKLAAVLKQHAHDSLLDSYEVERRAFARQLVETTDRMFSVVTTEGSLAELFRTRVAPLMASAAFSLRAVREFLFRTVSQTGIAYPESPLSSGQAGHVKGGDRLPWVKLAEGGDNHEPLSAIRWQVHCYGVAPAVLSGWCRVNGVPLHRFAWGPRLEQAGFKQDAAYLIRPDGYVAVAEPMGDPAAFAHFSGVHAIDLGAA